jgi:multisubunit Na+/H+ antiporter MnhC subunit
LFAAISLYFGKGLLALREKARRVAIGWFVFTFAHTALIALVPSFRERMMELQLTVAQTQQSPVAFDPAVMTTAIFISVAIFAGVCIWFLIRNRPAFSRAEPA